MIGADDLRLVALVVGEADLHRPGALHDVVVRDDVPRLVDDEAGAERALLLHRRTERIEEGVGRDADHAGRRDLDDPGREVVVDLADGQAAVVVEVRADGGRRHGDLADRRLRLGAEAGCDGDAECDAGADCTGERERA